MLVLSLQGFGAGSIFSSVWCCIYHCMLVILVLTCLFCDAGYIIVGLWYWFLLACCVVLVLSIQTFGTGTILPALWFQVFFFFFFFIPGSYDGTMLPSLLTFKASVDSNLPALWCWIYHSRLEVLVQSCFLCGAGSIISGFCVVQDLSFQVCGTCSILPVLWCLILSFQVHGTGPNLPALWCRIYHSRLVDLFYLAWSVVADVSFQACANWF